MRDAIKLAQAMMTAAGASLETDGIWGPASEKAWQSTLPEVQSAIDDALVRNEGVTITQIRALARNAAQTKMRPIAWTVAGPDIGRTSSPLKVARETDGRVPPVVDNGVSARVFVSESEALSLAREYDEVFGLPRGTLEYMLNFEAARTSNGFLPSARGGAGSSYLGLYQIHRVPTNAWADGARFAARKGIKVPNMYPDAWRDPKWNTIVAGGYAAMNSMLLRTRYNIPVTKETLYAAHQQGAGGFAKLTKNKVFNMPNQQSTSSVVALRTAWIQANA